MIYDCTIIGGGPAGLSAALVLGRARRHTVLFDENKPRNAVTQEAHGYLTQDGIKPTEFRQIAHKEIARYPSIRHQQQRVRQVIQGKDRFEVIVDDGLRHHTKTVILATGLKETLPSVPDIRQFYGKSLFSCPYCDGWEHRDQHLVLISEGANTFHMAKTIWNWSHNLVVCTNGHQPLSLTEQKVLKDKGLFIVEDRIEKIVGDNGRLKSIQFDTHDEIEFDGGFVATSQFPASPFGKELGCELNAVGGLVTDMLGRTTISGVYAGGEALGFGSQLIIAAAEGSRAAAGVNSDLIESEFLS
ncbi:MAG: NAD(P)/FAD-dependent oxidoreductase [Chloroflexota bacterium]